MAWSRVRIRIPAKSTTLYRHYQGRHLFFFIRRVERREKERHLARLQTPRPSRGVTGLGWMTPGFLPLLLFCGDIELEVEDVTVLDHIRLSFLPVFASFFHTGHASLATAELFEILECDGFGFNE